ncbi:MAG: outer membrane beta-barrel protein [Gemmatimonadota bacterium]|jgi:hypothetical protein
MNRTRLLLVVAAVALAVITAPLGGQASGRMAGFKVGSITTGVHSEVAVFLNTDWRSGLTAGAFVSIDPGPTFNIRADLLYAQRGFGFRMYEENTGLIPGEAEVRSMALQVDFGLRLPWPSRSAVARVFAGPAFGYELSCKVEGSMVGVRFREDCDQPVLGLRTQTVDVGFSVGGGMDFHFLPFTLVVDGRYTHGIRNLNRGSGGSEGLESRAFAFTVGLGWPF